MKGTKLATQYKFVSYGGNAYSATVSLNGAQQTWYAAQVDKEFSCILTGLTYYANGLHWTRPDSEDIISGEGMVKLSYGRFIEATSTSPTNQKGTEKPADNSTSNAR